MENIKLFKIVSCFVIIVFLISGCAGIISPSKGPNTLNTEPSGAEVFDANNIKIGTTPFNINTIPKGTRELKIKMEGYRDSELEVRKESKNDVMFVDAMLLCIPCPFDMGSSDMNVYIPENPVIKLRKMPVERNNSIKIAVDEVTMDANESNSMLINAHPKKMSDKGMSQVTGDVGNAFDIVRSALQNSFLDVVSLKQAENIKSGMARPKIIIKPVITEFTFDLKGKTLKDYTGKENLKCNWNICKISDKNKVVGTISTSTSVFRNQGSMEGILDEVFYQSSLDLLENDSLYDYLQKLEKDYLADTKGNEIKISSAAAPKYSSVKDVLKNSKTAVVTVISKDGFGSGFIISADGFVITNYHVIQDDKNITIKLNADMKLKATLVKSNKDYDLALLKIEAEDLKVLAVGNSDKAEAGDEVYAIGTPLETSLGQSITKGIISGIRVMNGMKFLQTDVSINPGNSGGPLLNDKGEVIGVATMKFEGAGIEGIGFCIPSNTVIEMLNIKF